MELDSFPLKTMSPPQETMVPHVGSQFHPEQLTRRTRDGKEALQISAISPEYLKPSPLSSRQRTSDRLRTIPSLSQLGTESNNKRNNDAIRHFREYSQDSYTPISALDSIFELRSASMDSPNSSVHSSFIAELEDTSPFALLSKRSSPPAQPKPRTIPPPTTMEFKSVEMTARAVIKVVDETIASIEAANRELLCRAEAAEEGARILREQNTTLQLKMEEYNRPKTAPSQPSAHPTSLRHRPSPSVPTPLSIFNARIDEVALNSPSPLRSHRPPLYPLHTREISSLSSRSLKSSDIDLANDPFSIPTMATSPHHRSPSVPLLPAHEISAPIPGTVMRHEVTYDGVPISITERRVRNIILEEARRREKPLPPLGPMSPSVLRGVVEIGTPKGVDEFGREIRMSFRMEDGKKKRKGLSGLFRRKVKERVF